MSMKFYDIQPGDDSHYVCENGQKIARFNNLAMAEQLQRSLMLAEVMRLEEEGKN